MRSIADRKRRVATVVALLGVILAGSVFVTRAGARQGGTARPVAAEAPTGDPVSLAAADGIFLPRSYSENGIDYRYQIFYPRGFNTARRWPVIVALHSSGEKGSDNVSQLGVGLGPYVRAHSGSFPAVVIFPQIPAGEGSGRHTPAIHHLIDSALLSVNADTTRIYLTGLSSGGVLAYQLARDTPGRYAAIVPVSAVVTLQQNDEAGQRRKAELLAAQTKALATTSVWVFHGAADGILPVSNAREAVAAFQAAGVVVKYTEYPGAPHVIWDRPYQNPELWRWLWSQHR